MYFGMVKLLSAVILLIAVLDVFGIILLSTKETLNVLDPVAAILQFAHMIVGIYLLALLSKFSKMSNGSSLKDMMNSGKVFAKYQVWYYVWAVGLCLINVVKGLSYIINGDFFNGLMMIAMGVALYLFLNKTNNGMKDKVMRELGEKSKALRDKLVENQKGALPEKI